jgi:extracellular factor (EF) 3-hydroxypalmitic acid methyl ester biosynthesis protein
LNATIEKTAVKQNLVTYQNSQGIEGRGSVLRLARHSAAFEIYSADTVLRTSELLRDFKVIWHDRTVFSGRAVVRNVVNTGLVTICEVTLEEGWSDVDFASSPDSISGQFKEFLGEWQKIYRVMPEYKVVLADLQTFLTDLRLWLEQVELGIRSSPSGDRIRLEHDMVKHLAPSVVPAIAHLFDSYEQVARRIEPDLVPAHQAFGKRQLHPLLLSSPFVYRTYAKPLGYAGDYEMVNMMFRDAAEGGSLFAKMVNVYALQLPPVVAHRNRIKYLTEHLGAEALRVAARGKSMRVFNLGCGPAQEIQHFLTEHELSGRASFTLLDFNDETLAYSTGLLNDIKRRHGRTTELNMAKKSVHQILKQADRVVIKSEAEQFDLIYCAGLFDYLSDKVCRKLMDIFYDMLAPGGLLLSTNVAENPARNEMECFLEWHVIHRTADQMRSLSPGRTHSDNVTLKQDSTGGNVFLEVRKPTGER